ncbi:MAG: hypothetical protein R3C56_27140 [Pirellulaceae bacterium]
MDSYPRPLSRQRLGQLIHGLQTRFSSSAQEMSREVQRLSEQLSQLEAARAQQLDDFEQQRRSDRESSTHEWDETLSALGTTLRCVPSKQSTIRPVARGIAPPGSPASRAVDG